MFQYKDGLMSSGDEDIIWPAASEVRFASRGKQRLCRLFGHKKKTLSTVTNWDDPSWC
jgi:hypothetical protein